MSTYKQREEAIVAWVTSQTGVNVILANQNAPQPSKPYISIAFIGQKRWGTSHEMQQVDTINSQTQTIIPRGEIHASISAFTTPTVSDGITLTSFELLQKLRDSADLDSQKAALALVSVTVMDASDILNLPEALDEAQWVGRSVLDIIFGVTFDPIVETVPFVERISGVGPYNIPFDWDSTP